MFDQVADPNVCLAALAFVALLIILAAIIWGGEKKR